MSNPEISHTEVPLDEVQKIVSDLFPVLAPYPTPNVIVAVLTIAIVGMAPNIKSDDLTRTIESTSQFIALFLNAIQQEHGETSLVPDINDFPDDLPKQ